MNNLKISIITVSYNSRKTIADTIRSVINQSYNNIEYIIVDGNSNDGTVDIIKSFGSRVNKFISESDNGIYDAMNKGIQLAEGGIVGILNSDDVFYDDFVVQKIADAFHSKNVDAIYGDVQFIHPEKKDKVVRYYSSKKFELNSFRYGLMPAHPSFYVKKNFFEDYGYYKTDYKIAADFELLLRFLFIHKINSLYLNFPFVSMSLGGVSTNSIFSNFILNKEIKRACVENGIKTNYLMIYSKYIKKIFEYIGN